MPYLMVFEVLAKVDGVSAMDDGASAEDDEAFA